MIEVWGRVNSINVQKVMWTLGELGVEYRRTDVGGPWGGTGDPDFVAMNPNRLVPVIRDRGTVIWESHVCVRYLAARYGDGGLWPTDPLERALSDRWMDWMATTLHGPIRTAFWELVRTPPKDRDAAAIEEAVKALGSVFGILDRHLETSVYVGGDRLTMGDIPVGCAAYRYFNLNIQRADLPNLARWYRSLTERPAYRTHVMVPVT